VPIRIRRFKPPGQPRQIPARMTRAFGFRQQPYVSRHCPFHHSNRASTPRLRHEGATKAPGALLASEDKA
jgi:hypothetical protein